MPTAHCALTIAGADPSGTAGIQADLKAFAAHRVHGLSVITALTAGKPDGALTLHVPPLDFLQAQIDACFGSFSITAVKLGMLANSHVIHAVADALEARRPPHVVLDPVMLGNRSTCPLDSDARRALQQRLLPLATLLTPNIAEAAALIGRDIHTSTHADAALEQLLALGPQAVLLKGGRLDEGIEVINRYSDGHNQAVFSHPRLPLQAHGSGGSLAAAITALLCREQALSTACESAIGYVVRGLQWGYRPGVGALRTLDHIGAAR